MASLTFVAGPINSQITASNTKADTVFTNAALLLGYEGDINNKSDVADFVMGEIRKTLTGWSRLWEEREIIEQAVEDVGNDPDIAFED